MTTNPTAPKCGHCNGLGDIDDGDHFCFACGGSGKAPSAPNGGEKLAPCPFCGAGEATGTDDLNGVWVEKNDHDDPEYHVRCWSCGAQSIESLNRETAIAAWNTRTSGLADLVSSMRNVVLAEAASLADKHAAARREAQKNAIARKQRQEARDHESMSIEAVHIASAIRALQKGPSNG